MARIRTIKPDYWGDPKTAAVSLPARLLFVGLLTEADDEGRFLASGKKLAGSIFPNDEDVTPKRVLTWLVELEHVGFVARYECDGVEYAHIPNFKKHQRISHPTPSRLPSPTGEVPEPLPKSSGATPESFVPEQGTGNREEGTGNMKPAVRARDPIWDALIDCWQLDASELTKPERDRINAAAKQLRDVDADPSEIPARRQMYALLFPTAAQTMMALAGRWAECRPDPARRPKVDPKDAPLPERDGMRFMPGAGWVRSA